MVSAAQRLVPDGIRPVFSYLIFRGPKQRPMLRNNPYSPKGLRYVLRRCQTPERCTSTSTPLGVM